MSAGRWKRRLGAGVAGLVLAVCVAAAMFWYEPLEVNDEAIRWHLWRQHVRSEYVEVDGHRLHYFEAMPPAQALRASGEAPKLLLIHGLGSRGEDWSPMIPTLAAQGFHVYAPDLLGYGRSDKPDVDYSVRLEEQTVLGFMQAEDLGRVDVMGWSMGGWVALKIAAEHPALVDRLVVYDAAGVYFPPTFDASLFTPTDSAGLARLSAMLSPEPKPLPDFVSRAAVRRLQENAWVIGRSVRSMEAGRDLLDFRLHQVKAPTLLVWGEQDRLIPLAVGEAMHRKIPRSALLVVEGCGHLAPGECSRPVLKGTVEFLKAMPAVESGEARVAGK